MSTIDCPIGTPDCGGHVTCAVCSNTVCTYPEGGLRMHWRSGAEWMMGKDPCKGSERSRDDFLNKVQEAFLLGGPPV